MDDKVEKLENENKKLVETVEKLNGKISNLEDEILSLKKGTYTIYT